MPAISWRKIRGWNGSQADAFEKQCCQLAHAEILPEGSQFIAKGKPDSGIECFWILPSGEEWGWQAKFFPDGLNKQRWAQCDDSVRRALAGHPKLAKLFFCIPCDFPDSRKPNQTSAAQQWESHKTKWSQWAQSEGRRVEFVLWNEHELVQRITRPEHRGRIWFWFDTPALGTAWFQQNVSSVLSLANERYSPDLNFELPLARHFDSLGRTPAFFSRLIDLGRKLNEEVGHVTPQLRSDEFKPFADPLVASLDEALAAANTLPLDSKAQIGFAEMKRIMISLREHIGIALRNYWNAQKESEVGQSPGSFSDYQLRKVSSCVDAIINFCSSNDAMLANTPAMLLVGEAGLGKTHLVCSVAERRAMAAQPTILFLGEQFDPSEPWSQIIQLSGLNCDRDTFLGALDACGEASGHRTLIIIDAINEGPGIRFWQSHLAVMLSHLRNYRYVGIALTIRQAYFEASELPMHNLVPIVHRGFSGVTGDATRHFFSHYGLAEPNVPMLDPEFNSPLILKLVCQALKNSGRHELPSELVGVTAIFNFVFDETDLRLAKNLDYAPSERLVQKSIRRVSELMVEAGVEAVPFETVQRELNSIRPSNSYSSSLLRHLIAEHILVQLPGPRGTVEELIRFTYQRMSDHLIVQGIIAATPKQALRRLFMRGGLFWKKTEGGTWYYGIAGWIEALAVQLPESQKVEIDEIAGVSLEHDVVRRAFLLSLLWRNANSFTPKTQSRIERLFRGKYRDELLEILISVSARPHHPYNADWLDLKLRPFDMASRDAWWSIYLFGQLKEEGNLYRLIEWARADRAQNRFSDEVVRLAALALTWCLTTSDRFVRDRATKALVSILHEQISVLRWLLKHFSDIDEPYVQERLYAVAYGCAMLTVETNQLGQLAQDVYDRIFRNEFPPASVLLRDHARGVIERALNNKLQIDCDPSLILPPYRSKWPKPPPSLTALATKYKVGSYCQKSHSLRRIHDSVTADDFCRYVLLDVSMWSDRRRKGKVSQSPTSLFKGLLKEVNEEASKTLEQYAKCMQSVHDPKKYNGDTPEMARLGRRYIDSVNQHLPFLLNKTQLRQFQKVIIPYLEDPNNKNHHREFDFELFQRLILRRVLQLGWTCQRFNEFDGSVSDSGRKAHKAERIGKKYQWIAYDEYHARISDNFGLAEKSFPIMDDDDLENGTWPDSFRDIDPSLLLQNSKSDGWSVNEDNWWTPHNYSAWTSTPTPLEWLQSTDDLPPPVDFLEITAPDKQKWMMLDGMWMWRRKEVPGEFQGRQSDRQEAHYIFRSYLVRREHLPKLMLWAEKQDWINDLLPSASHHYKHYLHEHYWSPHFKWPLDDDWLESGWRNNGLPHPVVQTTCDFLWEDSTYDCSLDNGSYLISLPSRWLALKMGLKTNGRSGDFVDSNGKVIAFDPSIRVPGHSTLLVHRESIRKFLEREKLALVWTLLGEKNIYPPEIHSPNWLGRLTILGAYSWHGEAISGKFRKEFFQR